MGTSTPLAEPGDLPSGLTVDEFLAWGEGRSGRDGLHAGTAIAMAPQRAGHALVKFAVQKQLEKGISVAGVPCQMFPDGMTVRIDSDQAYEPPVIVHSRQTDGTITTRIVSATTHGLDPHGIDIDVAGFFA
jgi:Uma2 family endonuclease